MNGARTNAVASGVYSSLARARSTPSARIRAWSKASGRVVPGRWVTAPLVVDRPSEPTGTHWASAASVPGVASGSSGANAR